MSLSTKFNNFDFLMPIKKLILKQGGIQMSFIKNFNQAEVLYFKDQVTYQEGQIVSKTLAQNSNVSITLFAFDKEEEISTHTSKGDALIYVMEGKVQVIIGDNKYDNFVKLIKGL